MRTSSAVKKDLSGQKLSTVRAGSEQTPPAFDRQRLVSELLSLGNDRIRPELAQQIGDEVEAELKRRASPHLSPEIISEIVQFKLEELGLIEIRRRRQKPAKAAEDEPTISLYPESEAPVTAAAPTETPAAAAAAQIPTLEKFLRPGGTAASGRPLPPKAGLKISARALRRMREVFDMADGEVASRLEALFEEIAGLAAGVEKKSPASRDPELLAVEFFNAMANQEFYPQLPVLFQFLEGPGAETRHWGPTVLSWRPDAAGNIFQEAAALWQRGGEVVFLCEFPTEREVKTEALETLLEGIEAALMALPEGQGLPKAVQLRLHAGHPQAVELADLALSGKYYPKFRLEWLLSEGSEPAALEEILKMTWKKSEPSLVCFDKASGASCFSRLGNSESAHPAATPALSRYEGGSLGSLNLSIVGGGTEVDWGKLRRMTRTAVHFLDNLFEVASREAEVQVEERRLGLGVMGFAELLLKLGIPYDGDAALVLAEKVFRFIRQEAQAAAAALAEQRRPQDDAGVDLSPSARHVAWLAVRAEESLADLAEVSPGLEPLDSLLEDGRPLALLQQIAQRRKVWTPEIEAALLATGSLREVEVAPRPLRLLFVRRSEMSPEWPLKILGAAQAHCDLPVTGTLDLPESLTLAELTARLRKAEDCGLRRILIPAGHDFIEDEVEPLAAEAAEASLLLSLESLEDVESVEAPLAEDLPEPEIPGLVPRPRPEVLQATTRLLHTGCGPLHVSFARDDQGPYEVRAHLGQPGTCANGQTEVISRLISLCLSTGVDQRLVYEQLRGVRCPQSAMDRGEEILSCSEGIARVFERELVFLKSPPPARGNESEDDEEEITAVTDLSSLQSSGKTGD